MHTHRHTDGIFLVPFQCYRQLLAQVKGVLVTCTAQWGIGHFYRVLAQETTLWHHSVTRTLEEVDKDLAVTHLWCHGVTPQ